VIRHLLVATWCALALGCSPPAQRFLVRRGIDLTDCFDASLGVGELTPYLRLSATDYAVVGAGRGGTIFAYGWHGRYGAHGVPVESGRGIPFAWNVEWPGSPPTIETRWPWLTTRTYDPEVQPGPRSRTANRFWIGAWATWVLSARAGLNPVELADFVVGWFGWDLLKDDEVEWIDWRARLKDKPGPASVF